MTRLCRERGIAWTILRPTLIYDPGARSQRQRYCCHRAAVRVRARRVARHRGAASRIHADDVAQAMIAALDAPDAANAILGLPGGETLTYRDMVRRICRSVGRRPVLCYLPLGPARLAFRIWVTLTGADYSAASLERMNMDLTLDPAPARKCARHHLPAVPPRVFRVTDRLGATQAVTVVRIAG